MFISHCRLKVLKLKLHLGLNLEPVFIVSIVIILCESTREMAFCSARSTMNNVLVERHNSLLISVILLSNFHIPG